MTGGGQVAGSLKVSGEFMVGRDLNHGDRLLVRVTDADGELVATAEAEVGSVTLVPIKVKDVGVVGTERAHKAKLV